VASRLRTDNILVSLHPSFVLTAFVFLSALQGDCKNAFCQGILPPEEITIVRPPSGDPDAAKDKYWLLQKTLYGLRPSPCHWYERIDSILRSIGLTPNTHDPCLYTGFVRDPRNPSSSASYVPLSLGLYVDDFVYFSEDPALESLFECLLRECVKFDFMGLKLGRTILS
jgi:hypothetical protein